MVWVPGTDVNVPSLLMTGTDLLDGDTNTPLVSRSETGRRIMCVKEDIGKYGMWCGVVVVYYESIKRKLKLRCIYECRCYERLQSKTKEFTCDM
jgi:hypothetical protein